MIQRNEISAKDDRLLSANDVINLIFKMAPRLIKRVYRAEITREHYAFAQPVIFKTEWPHEAQKQQKLQKGVE